MSSHSSSVTLSGRNHPRLFLSLSKAELQPDQTAALMLTVWWKESKVAWFVMLMIIFWEIFCLSSSSKSDEKKYQFWSSPVQMEVQDWAKFSTKKQEETASLAKKINIFQLSHHDVRTFEMLAIVVAPMLITSKPQCLAFTVWIQ